MGVSVVVVDIVKFLHLLLVLGLVGSLVASYYFSCVSFRRADISLKQATMRYALMIDRISFICMFFLFATGSMLVIPKGFTFKTPWINAAYILLTVAAGLQVWLYKIKQRLLDRGQFKVTIIMHSVFWLTVVIYIGIIHDAVTKMTYLRV